MSGIPIYTQSPVNASKASGATPQTRAPETQTTPPAPNTFPATTTATSSTSLYPSAHPGAAGPAPTAVTQRYRPVEPTPTTKTDYDGPPAPQPGPIPAPLMQSTIPPPPRLREDSQPAPRTAGPTISRQYPQQMSIPPLITEFGAQPPTSSSTTPFSAHPAYPVHLPAAEYGARRQSLQHPPGYYQNAYASEFTSEQRQTQDANNSSGLGGYGTSGADGGTDMESVWNTAKKWVSTAGDKLSETEAEIWRRINKE